MYITRILEGQIRKYLDSQEIFAVVGPRQSGKTTMLKRILSELDGVNYITLDDITALSLFKNDIKSFVELYIKNFNYVFIDEIQNAANSGQQLKFIYDTEKTKLIISGSSSAEISIQNLKYLVGRIFIFKLYPFSFGEFLSAKNPKLQNVYNSKLFGDEINIEIQKYIDEFITFGGYPRVVLSESIEEKKLVLKNIYSALLLREVKDLIGVSGSDNLISLIKALSLQIGNLINFRELSDLSGFNHQALKKNINILEELYICKRCYAFHKNPRTEIVKTPKIYFIDYGLRNIIIDNFSSHRSDKGALYENLIYTEFLKRDKELKYWRTKSGAEVDFILDNEPIEVKTMPKTSRSFYSFINKYDPKNGYIISTKEGEDIVTDQYRIKFMPYSKFI
ncbi:MAG: ATP-binding protein [Bacteroidetes bacterium]|nr:ATP-binding protein [Bacteroidota bacterium]